MNLAEKDRIAVVEIYKLIAACTAWKEPKVSALVDLLNEIQGVLEYNHEERELK